MGRHTPGVRRAPRRGRRTVATLSALAFAAGGLAVAVQQGVVTIPVPSRFKPAAAPECAPTVIRVAVSPPITQAVRGVVQAEQGRALSDGTCLRVDVQGMDPDQVVAATRAAGDAKLPEELLRLPHLWVPDSSIWVARASTRVPVAERASLASSPLVLMTSTSAAKALGWTADDPPTWPRAVTTGWPMVTDLTTDTAGLATAAALRASIPADADFKRSLAAVSLAVSNGKTTSPSAVDLVQANSRNAPIVPTTEQAALAQRAAGGGALSVTYPKGGSPFFDYPLVEVAGGRWGAVEESAGKEISAVLQSALAKKSYAAAGFRVTGGPAPTGAGVVAEVRAMPMPPAKGIQSIITTFTALAAPTRMLALVDISTSMNKEIRPGLSRIELVRDAASAALSTLPADSSVGAWVFASKLKGTTDYRELAPVARLDLAEAGGTHRQAILDGLKELPNLTVPGGTSIYDTTQAAVQEMRATFDGRASNAVVVFTDGKNEDREGLGLAELVADLKQETAGGGLRVVTIGIGPDADIGALRQIARATPGGQAYQALTPQDLQAALLDSLSNRS